MLHWNVPYPGSAPVESYFGEIWLGCDGTFGYEQPAAAAAD